MIKKPNLTLVDANILINSPISDVYAFLANHENYVRWFPSVIAINSANDLAYGSVGKLYDETLRLPTGRLRQISIKVMESQPPQSLVMEGSFAPLHPRTEIALFAKSSEETVLHWKFLSRNQSPLGRLFIRALVKRAVNAQSKTGLKKLASILDKKS